MTPLNGVALTAKTLRELAFGALGVDTTVEGVDVGEKVSAKSHGFPAHVVTAGAAMAVLLATGLFLEALFGALGRLPDVERSTSPPVEDLDHVHVVEPAPVH